MTHFRRGAAFAGSLLLVFGVANLVGCGAAVDDSHPTSETVETEAPAESPTAEAATETAAPETTVTETVAPPVTTTTVEPEPVVAPEPPNPVADWSAAELVGAVFMVGTPAGDGECSPQLLTQRHVLGLFLSGRSQHGSQAISDQVADCRALATARLPLLVATDQEGGLVQVLQGEGFDRLPSALEQSEDAALRDSASGWATQLSSADIDVNFAPVVDLVEESFAENNPPIGAIQRNYGFETETVVQQASAFAQGMQDGGVIPTLKHFPGLGRVTVNTDFGSGVVDTETTSESASVQVYYDVLANLGQDPATAPWIMVSTAVYDQIDPNEPAAFSPIVVDLARQSGFSGVLITDDLSDATQVESWSPGDRAIHALEAGVDVVLFSANIADVPTAMDAVIDRAENDPAFHARLVEAATRVVNVAAARANS